MSPRAILTAAETRAAEDAAIARGDTVTRLMARAGRGVAEGVWRFAGNAPTLILCGPGNNGGDGYVAATELAARGVAVRVAASAEPATDAARAARAAWPGPVDPLSDARPAPILVDALFGTGLRRALEVPVAAALLRLAAAARVRVAVDVPSGIDADAGTLLGEVPAFELTLALGALKPAHRLQPAAARCGRVALVDLGLAPTGTLTEIARPAIRAPGVADHKYSRGYVFVVGGAMPGAAMLSARAAQRGGAGYVAIAAAGDASAGPDALVHRRVAGPDALAAVLDDARIGAVVCGPGLGREGDARAIMAACLNATRPLVLDADALVLLGGQAAARLRRRQAPTVLTPHAGEFTALFGAGEGNKVARTRAAAAASGAAVVFKGADSVVADAGGRAAIDGGAPAWLASAGTGDVLSGVLAARLAAGDDAYEAACAALWLHGEAARRAGPALIADDLMAHLAPALAMCLG